MDYSDQWQPIANEQLKEAFEKYRPYSDWILDCTVTQKSDEPPFGWDFPIKRDLPALTDNDKASYQRAMSEQIISRLREKNPIDYTLKMRWRSS